MRRILLLAAFIGLCATSARADQGIGLSFGHPGNVALTYRNDVFPVINVWWSFQEPSWVAASIDYWLIRDPLASKLDWYLGLGGVIGLYEGGGDNVALGVRLPVGLLFKPAESIEIFGEIVPAFYVIPASDFDLGGAIGIRYVW